MKFLSPKRTCVSILQDCQYRSEQSDNSSNTGGERDHINVFNMQCDD